MGSCCLTWHRYWYKVGCKQVLAFKVGKFMSHLHSTSDKILLAAIDLMAEKGYNGTTTKEIAARAGVNEVTLFRHFGSKQKLLEAAFDRFHYGEEMTKLFKERLSGDLHADLLLISRTYHSIMHRNRKLLAIAHREGHALPKKVHERAMRHPQQLKQLLTDYFTTMAKRGRVVQSRSDLLALSFMWMNFGAFMSKLSENPGPGVTLDDFIEESVAVFVRGLTP
jgi:TetR/AcrR family transcriptional repressor of mexJK operon